MEEVREKILNISKNLFLKQGYKHTTIRQIIGESDILTGSLYHVFKNKEEIFKHLIINLFDEAIEIADRLTKNNENPAVKYSIPIALQIFAASRNKRIAELLFDAYSLWTIFYSLKEKAAERNKLLFHCYNADLNNDDYDIKTIMVKGALYGLIANIYHSEGNGFINSTEQILNFSLSVFNVPQKDIQPVINETIRVIKSKKIVIMDYPI